MTQVVRGPQPGAPLSQGLHRIVLRVVYEDESNDLTDSSHLHPHKQHSYCRYTIKVVRLQGKLARFGNDRVTRTSQLEKQALKTEKKLIMQPRGHRHLKFNSSFSWKTIRRGFYVECFCIRSCRWWRRRAWGAAIMPAATFAGSRQGYVQTSWRWRYRDELSLLVRSRLRYSAIRKAPPRSRLELLEQHFPDAVVSE